MSRTPRMLSSAVTPLWSAAAPRLRTRAAILLGQFAGQLCRITYQQPQRVVLYYCAPKARVKELALSVFNLTAAAGYWLQGSIFSAGRCTASQAYGHIAGLTKQTTFR